MPVFLVVITVAMGQPSLSKWPMTSENACWKAAPAMSQAVKQSSAPGTEYAVGCMIGDATRYLPR